MTGAGWIWLLLLGPLGVEFGVGHRQAAEGPLVMVG